MLSPLNLSSSTFQKAVHVRIGVPDWDDYDKEACITIMDFLGWTYEFATNSVPGHVNFTDPFASTGLAGDLINGHIDMICFSTTMWGDRNLAHKFTYPTSGLDRQIYIIKNQDSARIHQSPSLFRPFSWRFWLMLLALVIVTIILFSAMRVIISGCKPSMRIVTHGIARWIELSASIDFGYSDKFNSFTSIKFASLLWLILWGLIILRLYTADMKSYLTVPDRLSLPFTDFEGFVQQLRMGRYQLQIIDENLPYCPTSYGDDIDCRDLFQKIFGDHPPIHINNPDQICSAQGNVVAAITYAALDIPDKLAHFVGGLSHASNLLAIREDRIVLPFAAFPVAKNFRHIPELNSAVISLQLALKTMGNFGLLPLTVPYRIDPIPFQSPITLLQLVSAFQALGFGLCTAAIAFSVEILIKKRMNNVQM